MIAFIRGTVFSLSADGIIIDNHGVGYRINFNQQDQVSLGQEVTVYTYQSFGQDDQQLFGFLDQRQLGLFMRLISVKGLGPKTAIRMLANSRHEEVVAAIEKGDVAYLRRMPGIGAKTASQIILDLKGKLVDQPGTAKPNAALDEALVGLKNLGYKTYEISGIQKELAESGAKTPDEYLKSGLKLLLKRKGS